MKNKTEMCLLCKRPINLDKDSYAHLIDYKEGRFFTEGYYHNVCWKEAFNTAGQMKSRVANLIGHAEKMMGIKKEKVYDLH